MYTSQEYSMVARIDERSGNAPWSVCVGVCDKKTVRIQQDSTHKLDNKSRETVALICFMYTNQISFTEYALSIANIIRTYDAIISFKMTTEEHFMNLHRSYRTSDLCVLRPHLYNS